MHQGAPASLPGPPHFNNGGNPMPTGSPLLFAGHQQHPLPLPHPSVLPSHLQQQPPAHHQPPPLMRPGFAPPLMGLEPPPPGMSPPPNQKMVGGPTMVGQPRGPPPRGQIPPPMTSGPSTFPNPGAPHLSIAPPGHPQPPPSYALPPPGVPGIPPHSQPQQHPPGVMQQQQQPLQYGVPDMSRPAPGAPGGGVMDFFSDMLGPKLGGPPAPNAYHQQQQAPPPPQQLPGYPPPQQYYYTTQQNAPVMDPHAQYPGAPPPVYDPYAPPHQAQQLYPSNDFNRGGKRSKRSASSDSSYSSRSPSPARSPMRVSGSSRRHGRRHENRRRSRSAERRGGSSRRYNSPDNHGRRRGPRDDELRRGHRSSRKASPAKMTPESSEARPAIVSTPISAISTLALTSASVSTTASATIAAATSTAASTSTAAVAASSTTSVSSSEATSLADGSKASDTIAEYITESSQDSQPQLQSSTDSSVTPSISAENVLSQSTTNGRSIPDAPTDQAVNDINVASEEAKDEAPSSNTEVTSGVNSDATAAETGTEADTVEDVLELGIEDDDLLAEVQSEDLLTSEQEKLNDAESKSSRSRHNSEEYRKRRDEREKRRRLREEEEREEREKIRQERAEERRRLEKARREERDRRRQEKEKQEKMNRLVGKGKTLPGRPSVVKLSSGAKAKSSGDETSDPQSSQAQSPAKDVPELDILDEDAMLAVFRERALLSMQEKKRQKILEKKEQRRKEKILQQQQEAKIQAKPTDVEAKKSAAADKPDRMKRLGPVAAAVIAGEAPKKIKISKKPALTEEEMEEKLLMSSDEEEEGAESRAKSPIVPSKTSEDAGDKKKPQPITPITFKKSEVRPLITPPDSAKESSAKSTAKTSVSRIKPPVSSTSPSSDDKDTGPTSKKIISLKSSKWSTKKDDQDKENSRRSGEKSRLSPSLEARLSPAPDSVATTTTSTKTSTKTSSTTSSTTAVVGKKIISMKADEERVVSKLPSPKSGSALERLGAPVREGTTDGSSDSDSSFLSSSEDDVEDVDESNSTKPRASIVKLAATVKSGTAEPVHAYEVATSSAPSKTAAAVTAEEGTSEARWSDAVALSKKRRAEAESRRAGVREPISYEDLDASFNTAPRVTSSDENVLKTKTSAIKVNMASPSKLIDSPTKISATTKDDLLDLLELTAPVASSAPSKNNDVDTKSFIKSLPVQQKQSPAIPRPTWGRRRIEAPDSSSSTTSSSRKLVIRRSTGTAAVALATGGDARREIDDIRKRRIHREQEDSNVRDETEDDIGGLSPSVSSPPTSPDRSQIAPSPPKKISPGGRKLGIQRPTWLSSKAEKVKPTTSVTPTVAATPAPSPTPTALITAPTANAPSSIKLVSEKPKERPSAAVKASSTAVVASLQPKPNVPSSTMSQTTRPVAASAAFVQRDSRSGEKVEEIADVDEVLEDDVNGDVTGSSGKETIKNDIGQVEVDHTEYGEDDDLLAKTTDDEDEFTDAPALDEISTDYSKPTNPSLDLDDDDEDLFREIDAFL